MTTLVLALSGILWMFIAVVLAFINWRHVKRWRLENLVHNLEFERECDACNNNKALFEKLEGK